MIKVNKRDRVALFGGTFDPVHLGHRGAIDLLCQQASFSRVHWILSARPPHKEKQGASVKQRFDMLQLALADNAHYVADDTEARRTEKSYTIDTIETFQNESPGTEFVKIIGADSVHALPSWHRADELVDKVNWVVLFRPGYRFSLPAELSERKVAQFEEFDQQTGRFLLFELSRFSVSSSEIRQSLNKPEWAQTALIRQYLHPKVINYIREHRLYNTQINTAL